MGRKMYIYTKVYEIKRSNKGWSEAFEFWFNGEIAKDRCNSLQKWAKENNGDNFHLIERKCMDTIIHYEDEEVK